jgi:hypothetical protein
MGHFCEFASKLGACKNRWFGKNLSHTLRGADREEGDMVDFEGGNDPSSVFR